MMSRALSALPAFLFAAYPMAVVLSHNAAVVLLDGVVVGRALMVVWAVVAVVLWGLRTVIPDFRARAMWLNWLLLGLLLYHPVASACEFAGLPVDVFSAGVALSFTLGAVGVATVVVRPWTEKVRDPRPLTVTAVTILALALFKSVSAVNPVSSPAWRRPADAMIESAMTASRSPTPTRDIFYIVLDGMGSPSTLRTHYGLDTGPFVEFLRSVGFEVADQARANYAQTYSSLASALNMSYLDSVADEVGPDHQDRRPLAYLIQQNALMKLAKRAGYQVIAVGSDYQATEALSEVDVCLCPRYGLDEVEQRAINVTPLAAIPLDRWTFDAHRRKVTYAFSEIERAGGLPAPTFVFAHIVVPHPPFVFGPDGSPRRPETAKAFTFDDGSHFPGPTTEYRSGYHDQASFVVQRMERLVEALTRTTPKPVVIIHGDHGPGLNLKWDSSETTDMEERLGIFAAYLFPDEPPMPVRIASPINGARALARLYFGADLPPLPDKSFFSTWPRPYDFVRVDTPKEAGLKARPGRPGAIMAH